MGVVKRKKLSVVSVSFSNTPVPTSYVERLQRFFASILLDKTVKWSHTHSAVGPGQMSRLAVLLRWLAIRIAR